MRIDALQLPHAVRSCGAAGGPPAFCTRVDAAAWTRVATAVRDGGGRLVSMWGAEDEPGAYSVSAAYALDDGLLWVQLPAGNHGQQGGQQGGDGADIGYPDLSAVFPCAVRMQRAIGDLLGLQARGATDTRPWLNHGNWPAGYHPLRKGVSGTEKFGSSEADYPFVQVTGDGVHEIAVGPIHAGTIEPGHFRFSVVGEKVLRLEERFGYAHRGVERLFERTPLLDGHRLAARIAGDSTVAFSWAWCMAVESARAADVPRRAQWLRAMLLERERVANHLGDLGALGNDAGFAFGLAQFSRLKEDWLRMNHRTFGHRYLMDANVPGGVAADLRPEWGAAIAEQCDHVEAEVRVMQRVYDDHSGLQDRFANAGILRAEVADHFSVCGLAARASGRRIDLRADHPHAPYDELRVAPAGDPRGDVAARVAVRFAETYESLRLIRAIVAGLPDGAVAGRVAQDGPPSCGVGWVEGWRGDVLVALTTGEGGTIARCHCHDPSWQNWPALEHAIIGNIVPDFPLINKSFNLNYAGHDL